MTDRENELLLKKHWDEMFPIDKNDYRNMFLMSFKPKSAYHDYYSEMSLDKLINDSVFFSYILNVFSPRIMIEKRAWGSMENLNCEPDILFQQRLKQIKEKQQRKEK